MLPLPTSRKHNVYRRVVGQSSRWRHAAKSPKAPWQDRSRLQCGTVQEANISQMPSIGAAHKTSKGSLTQSQHPRGADASATGRRLRHPRENMQS